MSPFSPPPRFHPTSVLLWLPLCVCLVWSASGCTRAEGSGETSLGVLISADEITVENRTGAALVQGQVSIVPDGENPRPFTMIAPPLAAGATQSFRLTSFRSAEGVRFIGKAAKGRLVRVTMKDASGRVYEREVPFKY